MESWMVKQKRGYVNAFNQIEHALRSKHAVSLCKHLQNRSSSDKQISQPDFDVGLAAVYAHFQPNDEKDRKAYASKISLLYFTTSSG